MPSRFPQSSLHRRSGHAQDEHPLLSIGTMRCPLSSSSFFSSSLPAGHNLVTYPVILVVVNLIHFSGLTNLFLGECDTLHDLNCEPRIKSLTFSVRGFRHLELCSNHSMSAAFSGSLGRGRKFSNITSFLNFDALPLSWVLNWYRGLGARHPAALLIVHKVYLFIS